MQMLFEIFSKADPGFTDIPALAFAGEEGLTYKECDTLTGRLALQLVKDGINPGDRVGILSENMPHWGIAYLAINRAGAIAVPVLPDFPAGDVGTIMAHAEISACFVSARMVPKMIQASADFSCPWYLIDNLSLLPELSEKAAAAAGKTAGYEHLPEESHTHQGNTDDLAVILYTSGTTGHSKGVMLTNRNILFDAVNTSPIAEMQPGFSMLSILPLAHTYECTIGFIIPLINGVSVYYLRRPPSATVLMPALQQVRPHLMLSVPLLIEKLYRQSVLPSFKKKAVLRKLYATGFGRRLLNRLAGKKLKRAFGGRLYFFGIGGAALSPEVEDFLIEARFPYAIGYGLTETSPLIAGANNRDIRPRSTGPAIPGIEVKIDNPDAETGEGEILVKGPNVMQGYYKNPEVTAEVIDADGWFHTGDLGKFDEDQVLYIRGRMKNMILGPSGENIYPEAIESIINSFDFVEDSLVFQSPQGELLARVHINYDGLKEQMQNLADSAAGLQHDIGDYLSDLRNKVNEKLSSFSRIGKVIEQEEPFEKTPTQKIKRFLYDTLHPGQKKDDDKDKEADSRD